MSSPFSELRTYASSAAERAHTPFSGRPEGAALLLSDGAWVPGTRVESATYSLLIPPLLNAFTTAVAVGRRDVVAAATSYPLRAEDALFLEQALGSSLNRPDDNVLARSSDLPETAEMLRATFSGQPPAGPEEGIEQARSLARRAHVPQSNYRVGCLLASKNGELVPGVNVEHPDWSRILCAERSAIGTTVTFGIAPRELYLSCLSDPSGTPCGACRQVLIELAPEATLWIDRGTDPPEKTTVEALLPGAFRGRTLSL